ncbi:MAG: hypothetical protein ABI675_09945 [Chitinophagaceae bacterium]
MKLLLSGLLLVMSTVTLSQYADSSATRLAKDYQKKSNKRNTAGWVLLAGGAVLTTIGLIVGATDALGDLIEGDTKGLCGGPILMFTGLVSMAGSIPLFIAAGKNRRKATTALSFKIEKQQ